MSIPKLFNLSKPPQAQNLLEWRTHVLDGILRGILFIWIFALAGGINNVAETYRVEASRYENPMGMVMITVGIYISVTMLVVVITFVPKLGYKIRAGVLLFVLYGLGTTGLVLSSLSGDGRVLLFAFVILSAVFFEARFSLMALALSLVTLVTIGWLQVREVIVVPAERQINSVDAGAWLSGSIVFLILSIAVLISITYLLRAFTESLSQTRAKANELERLYAAAQDMAASIMDTSALLEALARHTAEALDITSCYIVAINQEQATYTVLAEFWSESAKPAERKSDLGKVLPLADFPAITKSISDGKNLVLQKDDENLSEAETQQFREYEVESMCFVPIMSHGLLLGDVEIWESRHRREFTQAEIDLTHAMAAQAGNIIENSQLFHETRRRAEEKAALLEASLALNTLDLESALQMIGEHARKLFSAGCRIFLLEPDGETLRCVLALEDKAELVRGLEIKVGEGMTGDVARRGQAEIVNDTLGDPRAIQVPGTDYFQEAMMFAPLHERRQLLGVMSVQRVGDEHPFTPADLALLKGFASMAASAISNASLFKKLEQRESFFRAVIENAAEGVAILDARGTFNYMAPAERRLTGHSIEESIGQSAFNYIHPDDLPAMQKAFQEGVQSPGAIVTMEYRLERKDGTWGHYEVTGHNLLHDPHVAGVVINYRDISERKRTEQELRESEAKFRNIVEQSVDGIVLTDEQGFVIEWNEGQEQITGLSREEVLGRPLWEAQMRVATEANRIPERRAFIEAMLKDFYKSGQAPWLNKLSENAVQRPDGSVRSIQTIIFSIPTEKGFKSGSITRDVTERKQSEEALKRHAEELEILVSVSTALRAATTVVEMIPIVVRQAVQAVNGAIGSIYLLDQKTGEFVSSGWYHVDEGVHSGMQAEKIIRHRPDEGITGYVATTRQIYITNDLHHDPIARVLPGEAARVNRVISNISLPLIAQEQIIGVLHVGLLQQRDFTDTEIRILTAIAEMAGNAIHRSALHDKTLQQADELSQAYNKTLEGWAHALELRDELTEGHTRRVTQMTLELARRIGISEADLEHIRRGAILHDIGKIGVPDSILGKPGRLTLAEKEIMQRHPQHAYDMLSGIPFLHPAMDIPYCHHEHWDGGGYPQGLKGEEIPLAARIFALVDVWDALTSDRPYRPAWGEKKAIEYVLSQKGKYFDPHITGIFLEMVKPNPDLEN
jgi:PAS domain S-box-containing protein/putative nucleotidyltransferase with HDIG domain